MATKKKQKKQQQQLVELTADQMRRLLKPHRNFEALAPTLLAIYEAKIDQMRVTGLDVDDISSRLGLYQSLEPTERDAQGYADRIKQTRFYNASVVWSALLEIYARARVAARTDADIKRAIAPFEAFMKPRRKVTATPPVPPTQPVSATTTP